MTETADYDKKAIPLAHTASHKSGGTDELDISGLVSKAHKASHQAGGADQISASGLIGRINLVDRGDPTPWDFTLSDFTTNGAWHDLPLDDIVPPGTICVKFYLLIQAQTIGNLINFRKKGNILGWNMHSQQIKLRILLCRRSMMFFVIVIELYNTTPHLLRGQESI